MNKNMKILMVVGVLVILLTGAIVLSQDEDSSPSADNSASVVDMSVIPDDINAEVTKAISRQSMANVVVLDVRTDEEWNELHATDAVHWGLVEHLENGEMPPLGQDMEIYIYCRSGNRAGQAIKIMQEAGYTNLTNIVGLDDWVAADGPTTSGVDGDDQGAN